MRWLRGALRRIRRDRDRGSVSVIVAALFFSGLMLGCAALTVDVGSISAERRQLQNGADAVALAAATMCVKDGSCPSATDPGLTTLADDNAQDDATKIARVDGGTPVCGVGPGLPECPTVSGDLGDCVDPDSGPLPGPYLRVYTQTESKAKDSTILPYFFGEAVVGGDGTTQQTCATATWGTPGSMSATIPFTFSACEWTEATHGDPADPSTGVYPSAPPYPPYPGSSFETVIKLNNINDAASECETWNGHDVPGGFGWLDDGGAGTCQVPTTSGDWKHIQTGSAPPNGCINVLSNMVTSGKRILYIPVYDCMADHDMGDVAPVEGQDCYPSTATGQHVWYHLAGYAKFYLTGYVLAGGTSKSVITGTQPCTSSQKCLSGFFLKGLVPQAEISTDPTTPSFGLDTIQMAG